jgi:hypothetical protein
MMLMKPGGCAGAKAPPVMTGGAIFSVIIASHAASL